MKWKHSLDLMRAVAILLVLFYHFEPLPSDFVGAGIYGHIQKGFKSGVELFFVLSGFLISSHWFAQIKNKDNFSLMMRDFYVKRTFRIIPLYYLILIFEFSRAIFLTKNDFNFWSYLTLTQNIFGKTIFPVSWSLCVEEHFYLFFPLVSFVFFYFRQPKLFVTFLIALISASFYLRFSYFEFLLNNPKAELDQHTAFIMDGLVVGVLIAYLFSFHENLMNSFQKYIRAIEVLGTLFFALGLYFAGSGHSFAKVVLLPTIFSIGYGLWIVSANFDNSIFNLVKNNSFISLTSKISYPLYLTHYTAWMALGVFFKHTNITVPGIFALPIYFGTAYGLAIILHELVEKRFLLLRNKYLSSRSSKVIIAPI